MYKSAPSRVRSFRPLIKFRDEILSSLLLARIRFLYFLLPQARYNTFGLLLICCLFWSLPYPLLQFKLEKRSLADQLKAGGLPSSPPYTLYYSLRCMLYSVCHTTYYLNQHKKFRSTKYSYESPFTKPRGMFTFVHHRNIFILAHRHTPSEEFIHKFIVTLSLQLRTKELLLKHVQVGLDQ
jgi:hypothetical protein